MGASPPSKAPSLEVLELTINGSAWRGAVEQHALLLRYGQSELGAVGQERDVCQGRDV